MISLVEDQNYSDGSAKVSLKSRSTTSSVFQKDITSLVSYKSFGSHYKAMYQDKHKSAEIITSQRRFSSCGNLGKQLNSSEGDLLNSSINHVSSVRSSSFPKAPHFISSIYHSVDGNNCMLHNQKFVHSSSVEFPPQTFNVKRLRSGSCPQVLTSIKLRGQVSLHNTLFCSNRKNSSAFLLSERKKLTNSRKSSVPCFEKLCNANFFRDECIKSFDEKLNKKSLQDVSFDSSDSSIAGERNEAIYSDVFSSYEDLNKEEKTKSVSTSQDNTNLTKFFLISSLKRTASTEHFSLPCGSLNNYSIQNFPLSSEVGLQKYAKGSFYSNSDIYNLKSPMDVKTTYKRSHYEACGNAHIKIQDTGVVQLKEMPDLSKTFSDQHLSSPQMSRSGWFLDFEDDKAVSISKTFDKKCCDSSNKSSVYVSSVFLNLSNSQADKHESKLISASFPSENCSFHKCPSALCAQQLIYDSRSKLPVSASNHLTIKPTASSNVLLAQKDNFVALLKTIKEAIYQKDLLQNEVNQMENVLTKNRQVLLRMEICPDFVQEIRRSNFILKSEILRLTQSIGVKPEANMPRSVNNARKGLSLDNYYNNQKWSYNPSYNGRH